MNRYSDYQIRRIAENECKDINAEIKYFAELFSRRRPEEYERMFELNMKFTFTRDNYIYNKVMAPDSEFTIDEIDAVLFIMCQILKNQYDYNISYQQLLKESHFEEDWEKENFGSMPHELRKKGWEHVYSADKLMYQFSTRTNFVPTYARMKHLVECINDDIEAEAEAQLNMLLDK